MAPHLLILSQVSAAKGGTGTSTVATAVGVESPGSPNLSPCTAFRAAEASPPSHGDRAVAVAARITSNLARVAAAQRPLLGIKRTRRGLLSMSANDPFRTSA